MALQIRDYINARHHLCPELNACQMNAGQCHLNRAREVLDLSVQKSLENSRILKTWVAGVLGFLGGSRLAYESLY